MAHAPIILWFRNDLRLADHPALQAALSTGRPIVPIYVLDDEAAGPWALGGAARWWLHHSLSALAESLRARGSYLVLRRGRSDEIIPALAAECGESEIFTGGSAEPWARALDRAVAEKLGPNRLRRLRTTMLFNPDSIQTKAGGPFSVYTPFSNACLAVGPPPVLTPAPDHIPSPPPPRSDSLDDWGLLPTKPDWAAGLRTAWVPGEAAASERLAQFVRVGLRSYAAHRDMAGIDGTSRLSPYLRFGEIAAERLWHAAGDGPGAAKFVKEVLWREFSIHLLWNNPDLPGEPLRPAFRDMPWRDDPTALRAWQRGQTGIPIVDAGMRQLWQTGWMHNRVRMIVASFLVKHLMIPWQVGEAWFWDTLVDADLASNAASWQWVAGCGADAAPYFRIFNPVLQGRKFDPDGAYVRQFVPELRGLDTRYLHAPWEARALDRPGMRYPDPIVDLGAGRTRALEAFAAIKRGR
jgi:deoxyribodipyrimidine photo-lyase